MKVKEIKASAMKRLALETSSGWVTHELRAEATAEVDPGTWHNDYRVLQDQLKLEVNLGMEIKDGKVSFLSRLLGGGK